MTLDEKRIRILLLLLFIGVLMGALDLAIIGPALPAIQAEFSLDDRQLAWLFNIYVLFQVVGTPLLAKMSDRYGTRAIYIFSIAAFAIGSLLLVVAQGPGWLFAGRAVQGFGGAGIFPVAASVIGASLPADKRGPALGLLGVVFGVAFLIGPILGGILLRFSWQWLFLINLPIAAALIAGAWRLLPAISNSEHAPFDWKGAATLSIGLTAMVLALSNLDSQSPLDSLMSTEVWPWALLFVVAITLFWSIEKRATDPIIRPHFLANRRIVVACVIAFGVGAAQAASIFYPAMAVSALGLTEANAAWLMLPAVLVTTVGAPLAGKLLNTIGSKVIIMTSIVLLSTSIGIYALAELSIAVFIIAGLIGGAGNSGLLGAPLRFILLNEAAPRDRGAVQGLLNVSLNFGQLTGAAVVGGIATSQGGGAPGYQLALGLVAAFILSLLLAAAALRSRRSEQDLIERGEQVAAANG